LSNDTGLTDNAQLKIQVNINPAFSQEQPVGDKDIKDPALLLEAAGSPGANFKGNNFIASTVQRKPVFVTGIVISTIGSIYTYKLYTSTDNSSLPDSGVDTESFSYTLSNDTGLPVGIGLIFPPVFKAPALNELAKRSATNIEVCFICIVVACKTLQAKSIVKKFSCILYTKVSGFIYSMNPCVSH
jgi:hypothetical protein